MDNVTTYQKIESRIYLIDGILSFLKAIRTKLFFAVFLYILAFVFEYILRNPIEYSGNCDASAEQHAKIKNIHNKLITMISLVSDAKNPYLPEGFRRRFIRYEEFLENMVDGLAISADREAKEYVERLPAILRNASEKMPTLDDMLKTM